MAILSTDFPNSLDRDIDKVVYDQYTQAKTYYDKIAKFQKAPVGPYYQESELSSLEDVREIKQGNPVSYDVPEEGNKWKLEYTEYGLAVQLTKHMFQDNVHPPYLKIMKELSVSAAYKPDLVFWDQFNNGFATHKAWDNNYIWVNGSHVMLKSGFSVNNRPSTDAALSETTLQAAFEYFDGLKNTGGRFIDIEPNLLIVPTALRWTAMKLWKNEGPYESADRNINTLNPDNMPESWRPWLVPHLTSTTAWWLVSSKEIDTRFSWKQNMKLESSDDFGTGNALFKVTERFGVETFNYIGGYGTTGA